MFTKAESEFLLRRLQRNEVVLFVGAGFAAEATNHKNEKLPIGKQLAEKIWNFIGMPGSYDGTPLQTMYEALLNAGIKQSEIKKFLEDIFLVKKFPDYYLNLILPYWYKIYTTNIDNLLEKIYSKSNQKFKILKYPKDEFQEVDKSLETIQFIYLNGKLPCEPPNELIFSKKQYARSSNDLQPLYHQFVNDYSTTTTVFLGTSIDEPIFEQYITARQTRPSGIAEHRPQSYLIDQHISPARELLLKNLYNIVPIKASVEEFLNWINNNKADLLDKMDTLKVTFPSFAELFDKVRDTEIKKLGIYFNEFSSGFRKVNPFGIALVKDRRYLLGSSPTWNDIYQNFDAPRKITKDIFEFIEKSIVEEPNQVKIISLLGSAGSGKSTILKRLALQLAQNGRSVFFSYSEYIPEYKSIVKTLNSLNDKVILILDNADLMLTQLQGIVSELHACTKPPIIIISTRTNAFDRITGKIEPIIEIKEFKTTNLDKDEIIALLKILEDNNLLGHLKGLTQFERIKEFENRAKKQILIAMREATKGENFDVIIHSEYQEIVPKEVRFLVACIALTTEAGFTVSKQDFVGFSDLTPAETLYYLERNLHDVVIKAGPKEDRLLLRHSIIAEYIINHCLGLEELKKVYLRILTALAPEINIYDWKSRKYTLYREIINHFKVYRRFAKDINNARELYESLMPYFNMDFQFWLQYGSLELEGKAGSLELAENYLLQAESLRPHNTNIKNALANLYYKKSISTGSDAEAVSYREYANELIDEMLYELRIDDPYTYHIYCKGNYIYIVERIRDFKVIKKELEILKKVIEVGLKNHPLNKRLQNVSEIINKAYLLTSVKEEVTFPLMPNDFE